MKIRKNANAGMKLILSTVVALGVGCPSFVGGQGADCNGDGAVDVSDLLCQGLTDVATFVRGDSNGDGAVDLSDVVFTLGWLFQSTGEPGCVDALDANDDGGVDISDPIYVLTFRFTGGNPPPPPYASCGIDTTGDSLDCAATQAACLPTST